MVRSIESKCPRSSSDLSFGRLNGDSRSPGFRRNCLENSNLKQPCGENDPEEEAAMSRSCMMWEERRFMAFDQCDVDITNSVIEIRRLDCAADQSSTSPKRIFEQKRRQAIDRLIEKAEQYKIWGSKHYTDQHEVAQRCDNYRNGGPRTGTRGNGSGSTGSKGSAGSGAGSR
jgi:hypothetical protein